MTVLTGIEFFDGPETHASYQARRDSGRAPNELIDPVLTSCDQARVEGAGRTQWIVDDYFVAGPRTVRWFGTDVRKYHRSVEDYFQTVCRSGWTVLDLREGEPSAEVIRDPVELRRRQRVPVVLLFSARRGGPD